MSQKKTGSKISTKNINPLGLEVGYESSYNPQLLFPIKRLEKRVELGLEGSLPFIGEDIWNAYEISWLNNKGLPQVAIAEFRFQFDSENIVESKSLKLYLNSLNQSVFSDRAMLEKTIAKDLSKVTNSNVLVSLLQLDETNNIQFFKAKNIDIQDIQIDNYSYQPDILANGREKQGLPVEESLMSHLLKSNCLITNQPDWASSS